MTIDEPGDGRSHHPAALIGGAILLALGAAMLVDRTLPHRLGELTAPFVLIVLGTSMLFGQAGIAYGRGMTRADGPEYRMRRVRRSSTSGVWLIGIGAWMLVSQAHMFNLSFDTSWPLLVILGGILIVLRGLE